jgi:Acyl-ACP thioesterase.
MIDLNGHVHNTMYLDLAAEVLPDDLWRRQFDSLEIHYRKEILPGQTVLLLYGEAGGTHYVQLKSEDGAVLHAVIALSD